MNASLGPHSQEDVKRALAEHPTLTAAAQSLGVPRTTLSSYVSRCSLSPSRVRPQVRPIYRISQQRPDGLGKTRVLAIGDAHDSPRLPDKSRFRWFGAYAADSRPDIVLSIGDLASLDSLCSYERNDTYRGKSKPTFGEDMASLRLALDAFKEGVNGYRPELHITLGNHEDRIVSFSDRTPEVYGMLTDNLHTVLTDKGWSYSPFGAHHYIGGVAFTHVPLNGLGKPYGGMHAENQIARDSLCDVVYGHSHKKVNKDYPKLDGRKLTILNLACALPQGHVEDYAKHSLTGWDWGIYDLEIQHGHIQKAHWVPMAELQERFG